MTRSILSWRHCAAVGALSLLGACAQPQMASAPPPATPTVASNPPVQAPSSTAVWRHVNFTSDSAAIDGAGQVIVNDIVAYLQSNPAAIATIIGKTDSVGGADYNMRLSHQRADAVRDALVYGGRVSADRVETRWTGETGRQKVSTTDNVAAAANRVVDIALH